MGFKLDLIDPHQEEKKGIKERFRGREREKTFVQGQGRKVSLGKKGRNEPLPTRRSLGAVDTFKGSF